MDVYVNTIVDAGVEVLRNAIQTVSDNATVGSQDIDMKLDKFLKRQYHVDLFAVLNFSMDGRKQIILPKKKVYHDRVYTYQHSTNRLYRGDKLPKQHAVFKLRSHHYGTVAERMSGHSAVIVSRLLTVPVSRSEVMSGLMVLVKKL